MNTNKIDVLYILLSITLISLTACKKLIEVDKPIDQLTTNVVFKDSSSAESAVVGLYSQVMYGNSGFRFLNGGLTLYPALSSDELSKTTSTGEHAEFENNSISTNNNLNYTAWRTAYNHIYHANLIMENLANSPSLTSSLKGRLTGELKFMRGLHYFYLVNCYGSIPMALTSDYRINALLPRSDSSTIYHQIIDDLKEAQQLLFNTYATNQNLRATYWSATGLLARVYLYQKDWNNAKEQASTLINKGPFSLDTLSSTFSPLSSETILQFFPGITATYNSAEGFWFVPASATVVPSYELTAKFLAVFEQNDLRFVNWVTSRTINSKTYFYPFKYKIYRGADNIIKSEYNVVLRLAEQFLIRAEAFAESDNLSESIKDLDVIRHRAGLKGIAETNPAIAKADLIGAIYHERETEFFAEWGHRWFDLKRTGRADAILKGIKPLWKSTSVLFPIPQSERTRNPNLSQNDGY